MMTFKQLEAIYWVVQLGGFSQAAQKLHTTQSAVSKRVLELEALFGAPLFDRSLRASRLTEKGEAMFVLARKLLEQRDAAVEQLVRPEVLERRVHIGVTEITAMTWLPSLVNAIHASYPKVIIEPDVDNAVNLREKLLAAEMDLIIVAETREDDPRFSSRRVSKIELAWMCKPGTINHDRPLRAHELARYRLLTQGEKSGTGIFYNQWLKNIGVTPLNTLSTNSLIAMIGLTVSGLGISYLPRKCLQPMIDDNMLEPLKVTPALPDIGYVVMHKREQRSTLIASIVKLAQQSCNFDRMYQTEKKA
jgi:DNA-binding transcriptional LysR family regulator